MSLLDRYFLLFGEEPPKAVTIGYDNEIYTHLMIEAINKGKPITGRELDKALEGVEYDVALSDKKFSKFSKKNA